MTFLNLILLGGSAAAVIPFLIHLFRRSQFRIVPWGAMQFLRTSSAKKRRVRIEQWILLLLRAAILLTLALCMARPVFTGMRSLLGNTQSSVAILLDNSLSMQTEEAGRTRSARARAEAAAIAAGLPRGSEAAVVWLAGADSPVLGPSFDMARLQSGLDAQPAGAGEADPAAAFNTAAALLAKAHYPARELVVVSDFQKANWAAEVRPALERALEPLRRTVPAPRLTFIPLGHEQKENLAVESLALSRAIAGAGQRLQVRATIRNYGESRQPAARVYFRVDGAERMSAQVALEPRGTAQALFTHAFETPGSHIVEAALDSDALKADNTRSAAVTVWDRVPVLLVTEDASGGGRAADAAFLATALAPYAAAGESGTPDLIDLKVLTRSRLNQPDFSPYRVVILAGLRDWGYNWTRPLNTFVQDGGGLLIFPAERLRADGYRRIFTDRANGFLPACFGAPAGAPEGKGKPAAIAHQHYDSPALDLFNDPRNGTLAGCAIRQWFRLETQRPAAPPPRQARNGRKKAQADKTIPEGEPNILARLDSGDPFLIEKTYGRGRAIVCATACDDSWSNLPARPCYLPLMQQLVIHLAARAETPRTLTVGQRLAALILPRSGEPDPDAPQTALLTDPAGAAHELTAQPTDAGELFTSDATWLAGAYTLAPPRVGAPGTGEGSGALRFAVNIPPRESDPALLARPEIEALAKEAGAGVAESAEQYLSLDRERRFGFELWKPLLAVILALVFLELFLEQRFARRV